GGASFLGRRGCRFAHGGYSRGGTRAIFGCSPGLRLTSSSGSTFFDPGGTGETEAKMMDNRKDIDSGSSCPPVLLLAFNRPDTTAKVIESLRRVRPHQVFLA